MLACVMIRLQACLLYSYQNKHPDIMSLIIKLQQGSFGKVAKVTWHLKNYTDRNLDALYSQAFVAQGRWMVGVKLIKATFWHCQTNGFHLHTISQMLSNVLDLPPSTCLCVCICLHSKHYLHRSLDLFASDLVLFVNSFFFFNPIQLSITHILD